MPVPVPVSVLVPRPASPYTLNVVHHFVVREWLLHLVTLEHLLEAEPGGPTWLWRIRIRILKYMLGRYGGEPTQQIKRDLGQLQETQPDQSHEPDPHTPPAPSAPLPTILRSTATDHPPKPVSILMPILDDIQLVNEQRRTVNASWAFPEAAWIWWRDEWCVEAWTKRQRD